MSTLLFLIVYLFHSHFADGFYADFILHPDRINRHCHQEGKHPEPAALPLGGHRFTLFLVFLSVLIFLLIALGVVKGLLGLCVAPKFGSYGLDLLIELPRPLSQYQECELKYRPVVYDVGGWPVHPDTLQRTVRVLSKRTEFCLNLVFFLACPLAVCAYICSLCCCIRNYAVNSRDNTTFKHVDLIRFTRGTAKADNDNMDSSKMDVYKEDKKEEEDTKYVLNAMEKSRESIHEMREK